MQQYSFHVSDGGTTQRAIDELGGTPAKVERARRKALTRLSVWVRRQLIKAISAATGVKQKKIGALTRFYPTDRSSGNIHIWIGTDPIAAQFLGTVSWNRGMAGAKVDRKTHPGTWSWGPGSKTGSAVMYRTGGRYSYNSPVSGPQDTRNRAGIAELRIPIHEVVEKKLEVELPGISEVFMGYLKRELRYALNIEGAL